jgi:glucokinase
MPASAPPAYLGIDLGGTSVKLGICEARTVRARTSIPTDVERGSDDAIARIAHSAQRLIDQDGPVTACGIGVPGELNTARDRLARANHFPGWTDVALGHRIGDIIGVPSVLENDANCAAWGELCVGAGAGTTSLACFTLGTGVGGGLVIGGELCVGASGAAASFGHITVDPNGPLCGCGQRGCVEQYASGTSIANRYGRGSAKDAFDAAARGDADAIAAIEWSCDGLAAGVANVVHTVQPEVIVLAGGVAAAGDALRDRVRARVARRVRASWLQHVRIECSALGRDAGWIGAALWGARQAGLARDVALRPHHHAST